MKYSTIILTAFAAGAMARAIPDGDYDPAGDEIRNTPGGADTSYDVSKDTYPSKDNDYGKDVKKDDSYGKDDKKDKDYKDKDYKDKDSYGKDDKKDKDYKDKDHKDKDSYGKDKKDKDSYGKDKHDGYYDHDDYKKPVRQPRCEDNDKKKDFKRYGPKPDIDHDDYKKNSCYDDFQWPKTIKRGKPCKIEWKPKREVKYTKITLYKAGHYDKPVKVICEKCEGNSYDKWEPECDASDVEGSGVYHFKFENCDNDKEYTWGGEFPVYGDDDYYKKNKKVEGQCEPEPVPEYPTPAPPAKAPEAPSYPVEAAPEPAPAPAPAPAPEAPSSPVAEPAPEPAPEAPVALVANETSPEVAAFASGSSVFRASISVIVGVAALVTFAL